MGTVHDILARKGSQVFTVPAGASVLDAARVMNEHKIGALLVELDGRTVGILTERDILTRIVADQRDPKGVSVAEVMTRQVLSCRPTTRLNEARKVMRERRIRHLPVMEQERVIGMISIGDLNHAEHDILIETIQSMELYIAGGSSAVV